MKILERKKILHFPIGIFYPLLIIGLLLNACSFDYGDAESEDEKADIVMEDIEYVRVRGGDPLARFQAEYAERWEERQTMELKDFTFEQLEDSGDTINAIGKAGAAVVQLESGDIVLSDGVRINIESEDIIIITSKLDWKDKEKLLFGDDEDEVDIERSDGTSFSGIGFSADIRNRTWVFLGEVKGTYAEDDEDEEEAEEEIGEEATEDL